MSLNLHPVIAEDFFKSDEYKVYQSVVKHLQNVLTTIQQASPSSDILDLIMGGINKISVLSIIFREVHRLSRTSGMHILSQV